MEQTLKYEHECELDTIKKQMDQSLVEAEEKTLSQESKLETLSKKMGDATERAARLEQHLGMAERRQAQAEMRAKDLAQQLEEQAARAKSAVEGLLGSSTRHLHETSSPKNDVLDLR
jgi:chromosome segregation ATPase